MYLSSDCVPQPHNLDYFFASFRLQQLWVQRGEAHANIYTALEDTLTSSRDLAVQHNRVSHAGAMDAT